MQPPSLKYWDTGGGSHGPESLLLCRALLCERVRVLMYSCTWDVSPLYQTSLRGIIIGGTVKGEHPNNVLGTILAGAVEERLAVATILTSTGYQVGLVLRFCWSPACH